MNLSVIALIFKNTIHKEWRSKTLFFLLIITVIMISLAGALLSYFKENILTDLPMEGLAQQSLGVFFWVINIIWLRPLLGFLPCALIKMGE